jgi:CDGSH-type Zn-finger protein
MSEVEIKITATGPYIVSGPIKLVDASGAEIDVSERKKVALCRCGGSVSKPFCDGTHSKIGFLAAEAAVEEQG